MRQDRHSHSIQILPGDNNATVAERIAAKTNKPKFVLIADNVTLETDQSLDSGAAMLI